MAGPSEKWSVPGWTCVEVGQQPSQRYAVFKNDESGTIRVHLLLKRTMATEHGLEVALDQDGVIDLFDALGVVIGRWLPESVHCSDLYRREPKHR